MRHPAIIAGHAAAAAEAADAALGRATALGASYDPRTIALTGLTRDGLWWIENGEVRHPVRNLRFNQSVLAMLAPWNVEAIGPSLRLSPFMVPPLKLAAFTFTSMSDAI